MRIIWYNEEHHRRPCNIDSIDDIQKYNEDELFCLRIRKEIASIGGALGKFNTVEARDRAYDDIKTALEAGAEEFDFCPGYYSR